MSSGGSSWPPIRALDLRVSNLHALTLRSPLRIGPRFLGDDEALRTAQDVEDFEQEIVDEYAIAMAAAGLGTVRLTVGKVRRFHQ